MSSLGGRRDVWGGEEWKIELLSAFGTVVVSGLGQALADVLQVVQVHLLELVDDLDGLGQALERVEQSHQLDSSELQLGAAVALEQDLQGGAVADRLQLAPHTAAVAAHAVHDGTDVLKAGTELLLEAGGVLEQRRRVEEHVFGQLGHHLRDQVGVVVAGRIAVGEELLLRFLDCQVGNQDHLRQLHHQLAHERVVEEYVGQAVVEGADPVHEHRQVRVEVAGGQQVLVGQVHGDRRVHARDHPVEQVLLHTLLGRPVLRHGHGVGVGEAVFGIDSVPHIVGLRSAVPGKTLRVIHQVYKHAVVVVVDVAVVQVLTGF